LAGMIEVSLKDYMADKTNWRKMLMNIYPAIDLLEEKEKTKSLLDAEYQQYICKGNEIIHLNYPVTAYPIKVKSIGFDKVPNYTGILKGMKGQYLLFENGIVLNIRKFGGYIVTLSC